MRFSDSFVDPTGVEALLDAAEGFVAAGGFAACNEFGVPTYLTDGSGNQISLVRLTFDPQE